MGFKIAHMRVDRGKKIVLQTTYKLDTIDTDVTVACTIALP